MSLAIKLVYFAVERAAEPVSERLEIYARSSPRFRATCRSIAEWQANLQHNKELRKLAHQQRLADEQGQDARPGHGSWTPADDVEPPPVLSEKEATRNGAELLGESFVISVGLAVLLVQAAADRADEARNEERVEANETRIDTNDARIRAMEQQLRVLDKRVALLEAAADGTSPRSAAGNTSSRWWRWLAAVVSS